MLVFGIIIFIINLKNKMQDNSNSQVDPTIQNEIVKLEDTVRQYQSESKYIEAIGVLEELLKIKKMNFGTNSKQFTKSCK
jgi:hypothetical protein